MIKHLKFLVFPFYLISCLNVLSYGQYRSKVGSFNLGLSSECGFNILDGAQFLHIKPYPEFIGGISIKYYQTHALAFQIELLMDKKGGRYSRVENLSNLGTTKVDYSQNLTYISAQFATNFYLSDRLESENFYLRLGIIPSFLIKANLNASSQELSLPASNNEKFRKTDLGILLGAGLEIRRLDLRFSYYLGTNNINADPNGSRISNHGPRFGISYFLKRWE